MSKTVNISFPNSPTYDFIFPFEEGFDQAATRRWVSRHWYLSFCVGFFYLCFVFGGRRYMANRPPVRLRKFLAAWNTLLSIFSVMGVYRTVPELAYVLGEYGWCYSVCNRSYVTHNKISAFWGWAFVLSKMPELLDTLFVVARKQKLTVIQWFHHVVTLCICWSVFPDAPSLSRWMMVVNFSIHAVMYAYFALRALRFRVYRILALCITSAQIIQMVMGLVGCLYVGLVLATGGRCQMSAKSVLTTLFGYATFFLLFLNFFFRNYVFNETKASAEIEDSDAKKIS